MARKKVEFEYARNATYGNVAYDLNRLDNTVRAAEPAVEYEYEPQREIKPRPARAAVRLEETRQGFSLFALVGFTALTVLVVLILMAHIQLTAINSEISELSNQIIEAQENETRLTVKYESVFDADSIREYAVNVLGMNKVTSEQITVLDDIKPDKAVVLSESENSGGGFLRTALAAVLEYFR